MSFFLTTTGVMAAGGVIGCGKPAPGCELAVAGVVSIVELVGWGSLAVGFETAVLLLLLVLLLVVAVVVLNKGLRSAMLLPLLLQSLLCSAATSAAFL
jgi:hypothetical protein